MAYNKHIWIAPEGNNLNRFTKADETEDSVVLVQNPSLTNIPTPFSVGWMNEMEDGIDDAHILIDELDGRIPTPEQLVSAVNAILERRIPVGSRYDQHINDPDPIEKGLPGQWVEWTGRAEGYRLGALPWPYDKYATGIAYAANAFVINPLNDGWAIYRASAAITAANNTAWNPAQWTLVLDLGEGGHIPYRLIAATAAFAVNDLAVHYWPDNYTPTQADYAVNTAYAANAFVKVLIDQGHWKIYKTPAAITAVNNTIWNPAQWEFVMDVRHGYKGVYQCLAANTAANPPVINPAQWKQVGELVAADEYLPFVRYQQNANYNANTYVVWHLPGTGYELWKAPAAITAAGEQLNPKLWEKYVLGEIIERRFLQEWIDDDFPIGDVIPDGEYAGMKVSEVISLGGTFPSFEGGNRPPFVSGGVAGEERHTLTIAEMPSHSHSGIVIIGPGNGIAGGGTYNFDAIGNTGGNQPHNNIPPTISFRYWRRVA